MDQNLYSLILWIEILDFFKEKEKKTIHKSMCSDVVRSSCGFDCFAYSSLTSTLP